MSLSNTLMGSTASRCRPRVLARRTALPIRLARALAQSSEQNTRRLSPYCGMKSFPQTTHCLTRRRSGVSWRWRFCGILPPHSSEQYFGGRPPLCLRSMDAPHFAHVWCASAISLPRIALWSGPDAMLPTSRRPVFFLAQNDHGGHSYFRGQPSTPIACRRVLFPNPPSIRAVFAEWQLLHNETRPFGSRSAPPFDLATMWSTWLARLPHRGVEHL